MEKDKVLIALKQNGQNGGPYVSHLRIMQNHYLNSKFDFELLEVPRARKLINPFGMLKFVRRIRKSEATIVHIAGLQLEGFLTMIACRMAHKKTVLAIHGSVLENCHISKIHRAIAKQYEKYTVKKASIAYGVSDYVTSWEICKYAKKYYGTIYNMVDFNYSQKESTIRQELGINKSDCVVVSTGRITTEKGFDILSDVILKLKDFKQLKFIIVGDGPFLQELSNLLVSEINNRKVFLLGYRSDIQNILRGSDIFIICSKHETLCISLLEAGFCKLPLIGTNIGGIPEIIDNDCGFLINKGDVDGFCKAIVFLFENSALRDRFGSNISRKIQVKFAVDNSASKILDIYNDLLVNGGNR